MNAREKHRGAAVTQWHQGLAAHSRANTCGYLGDENARGSGGKGNGELEWSLAPGLSAMQRGRFEFGAARSLELRGLGAGGLAN